MASYEIIVILVYILLLLFNAGWTIFQILVCSKREQAKLAYNKSNTTGGTVAFGWPYKWKFSCHRRKGLHWKWLINVALKRATTPTTIHHTIHIYRYLQFLNHVFIIYKWSSLRHLDHFILDLSIPDEGYSRNAPCALN